MKALGTVLRHSITAILLLLVVAFEASAQDVTFGPGLESTLAGLASSDEITVIVTFDGAGPLSDAQLASVDATGVSKGIYLRSLPMIAVNATASEVYALARIDGVRSIWPNSQLSYFNDDARDLTGVNRLQHDRDVRNAQGVPFSGRGVGVVVNDSGIDGTHPDLEYGTHVVENVQGLTNLQAYGDELDADAGGLLGIDAGASSLFPVTYTEGMINTDLSSGHGTHVAGTVGGTGVASDGKYAGVAPGADLIGYGSGAVLLVLDALGGFDYALTHQFDSDHAPIRIVTNSWGSSGDFEPNNPINVATYLTYQRGITVLFAAGNDGSGEDTHNPYAQAPWVISVGAGEKNGTLVDFSSRGKKGQTGTFTTYDNEEWTYKNEVGVVAPGVNIVSTRTLTGAVPLLGADQDADLGTMAAYYTTMSGTSMATPHVAGIVALMLEANPRLDPLEVKAILQQTATNMPGREPWEVGAGYVNAYAAVIRALGLRTGFGTTLTTNYAFNSSVIVNKVGEEPFVLNYDPVLEFEPVPVEVAPGIAQIKVSAEIMNEAGVALNTVALVLHGPNGERVSSGLALPALTGTRLTVSAFNPAPGTWEVTAGGIGFVADNDVDPLDLTNGYALPETIEGTVQFFENGGFVGMSDLSDSHPAADAIKIAVSDRLFDGFADGTIRPDDALTRGDLARYLVFGAGIRQYLSPTGGFSFGDVPAALAPFAEAVTAKGGALKDMQQFDAGVMRASGGTFNPAAAVTRAELAYSLIQSLGLQDLAQGFTGTVTAPFQEGSVDVTDAGQIPAGLEGYVFYALNLGLMNARFELAQGPFDLSPTITAHFDPLDTVTRGAYAVSADRYVDAFRTATLAVPSSGGGDTSSSLSQQSTTMTVDPVAAQDDAALDVPESYALDQNYPNPFNPSTAIHFAMPESGNVRLAVYDILGRQVKVLLEDNVSAGDHTVSFDAGDLASGTYLYRLETPHGSFTKQMILMK